MKHPIGTGIDTETELRKWDEEECKKFNMRRFLKSRNLTYRSCDGKQEDDYDHVFVAEHLKLTKFRDSEVDARDWNSEPEEKQKEWWEKYSPHSLLYFEVHKV